MQIADKKTEIKRLLLKQIARKQNPLNYFTPQDYQKEFFTSQKKNKGIFGGNRSGKTICGAAYVIDFCLQSNNSDCWAATWADMSIAIQQKAYYVLLPKLKSKVVYANFSEQRGFSNRIIIFANGSKIRFKTYDQGRESFQGAAKHKIHLDEEPPQDIVNECKARLIDYNGEMIRTMTPLDGITYTYDDFILNEMGDPEIQYWFWDSTQNKFIDQDAQHRIIGSFAPKEAEVRSKGHFLNLTTGNAYYTFAEENIIEEKEFKYLNYRPLEISCDFNVDLMCWDIGQEVNGKDYSFDFVELEGQANTELLCQMLKNKFITHKGGFIFYGDIAGNARRPESSRTNWSIIKENFPNAEIYYKNIRNIKDRIDSTNARLKNSKDEIKYFMTKNCKRLTKDFRQVTWEMLLNKNKAGKLTHASDGVSYKLFWKYPLTGKPTSKQW
jgi:phage terminase large subunit-like protein